ncbi:ring-cleaving dioxygenase (plasmid) [Deinococcus metallilatus]|uniref:Glyoxalase family protein n=1 Tax=Deinococcus metallilatus TaxID=1211322 RepID=A0ABR6MNM2_9DEIO|nr:ring-cleaving dioxygenase [Deinococcus metallilatus]MBB5293534.1 glyoxalase family protein [Deinococcus metallilatus]QBY06609.1 ring-cleaving dioxygenase [Deinococcus metallilatus]RXJ17952.1 ring-cleaving dioxygenase [Deinococcus metallilatus]GMA15245.1 glyoxalase [Deinococcus metallilatus]
MTKSDLHFSGIHHLTAVSANIRENKRFYTQDLGMRLVKRSVNQDDTSAYHLFYADKVATPGTDLTFFDWPVERERRGNHTVTRTALRVKDDQSLRYWQDRFGKLGIRHGDLTERDGRLYLDFEDPEGQRLSLVTDGGAGDAPTPWEQSPVPAEHQLRGLGPITMTVPNLRTTDLVLQKVMNLRPVREYPDPESPAHTVHVYEMGEGGPHAELHVAVRPDLPPAHPGAGGVHHVAFRTPNDEQYHAWNERLNQFGIRSSGEVDRHYFRSLYFREPNGVLFEIATDGPGFGVDEDMATLGEKTILPPFLEPRRAQILAGLKPLD